MAVAGLIVHGDKGGADAVLAQLAAFPGIVETRDLGDGWRVAAVLECPGLDLQKTLEAITALDAVLHLDVAYVNHEDDIDAHGNIPCPPEARHGGKRHRGGGRS